MIHVLPVALLLIPRQKDFACVSKLKSEKLRHLTPLHLSLPLSILWGCVLLSENLFARNFTLECLTKLEWFTVLDNLHEDIA
jgi:hypothetical protein